MEDVIEKYPDEVIQELLPKEFAKITAARQKKLEKEKKEKSKRDSKLLLSEAKVFDSFRKLREEYNNNQAEQEVEDALGRESQQMENHDYESEYQTGKKREESKDGVNDYSSQVFNS